MIRKTIAILVASTVSIGQPLGAQDRAADADEANVMTALAQAFPVEPLTREQQARLPLASAIIDRMIPPGTLDEMMGAMFDQILGPIMSLAGKPSAADLARQLGVEADELDAVGEAGLIEALHILDPAREERSARISRIMPQVMSQMMAAMEPPMRKAMSEAYSINFSEQELVDIDTFFSTESGLKFARKSFTMSSDPRIIGATMEALPGMMASMDDMDAQFAAATAGLPAPRQVSDLSAQERARLAQLTGLEIN